MWIEFFFKLSCFLQNFIFFYIHGQRRVLKLLLYKKNYQVSIEAMVHPLEKFHPPLLGRKLRKMKRKFWVVSPPINSCIRPLNPYPIFLFLILGKNFFLWFLCWMFPNISVGLPHANKGQREKYKYSEKNVILK